MWAGTELSSHSHYSPLSLAVEMQFSLVESSWAIMRTAARHLLAAGQGRGEPVTHTQDLSREKLNGGWSMINKTQVNCGKKAQLLRGRGTQTHSNVKIKWERLSRRGESKAIRRKSGAGGIEPPLSNLSLSSNLVLGAQSALQGVCLKWFVKINDLHKDCFISSERQPHRGGRQGAELFIIFRKPSGWTCFPAICFCEGSGAAGIRRRPQARGRASWLSSVWLAVPPLSVPRVFSSHCKRLK